MAPRNALLTIFLLALPVAGILLGFGTKTKADTLDALYPAITRADTYDKAVGLTATCATVLGPPVAAADGKLIRYLSLSFGAFVADSKLSLVRSLETVKVPLDGMSRANVPKYGELDPDLLPKGCVAAGKMFTVDVKPAKGLCWGDVFSQDQLSVEFVFSDKK